MSKEKEATAGGSLWVRELFQPGIYKRTQGRIVRQVTFAAVAIILVIGAWRLSEMNEAPWLHVGLPIAIVAVGLWFAYRLVNLSSFADFLIAVELEMNKVSWPSRGELVRSAIVVVFTIVFLALTLYCYDLFWIWLLNFLKVTSAA